MTLKAAGRPPSDAEWQAFAARAATGLIWGVVTTGIYCRDGCPARVPLRANLRVLGSPGQAEAAGFRACKRCKPDLPPDSRQSGIRSA